MTLDYLHIERPIVRLVNEHKKELSLQLLKMDLDLAGVAGRQAHHEQDRGRLLWPH